MPTILVPGPSPDAFNKQRRISDLLHSQITHFQHVAQKHAILLDPALVKDVHTEAGAARYIAAVTRALRGMAGALGPRLVAPLPAATSQDAPSQQAAAPHPLDAPAPATLPALAAAAVAGRPRKLTVARKRVPRHPLEPQP